MFLDLKRPVGGSVAIVCLVHVLLVLSRSSLRTHGVARRCLNPISNVTSGWPPGWPEGGLGRPPCVCFCCFCKLFSHPALWTQGTRIPTSFGSLPSSHPPAFRSTVTISRAGDATLWLEGKDHVLASTSEPGHAGLIRCDSPVLHEYERIAQGGSPPNVCCGCSCFCWLLVFMLVVGCGLLGVSCCSLQSITTTLLA